MNRTTSGRAARPINFEKLAEVDVENFVQHIAMGIPETAAMWRNIAKSGRDGSAPPLDEQTEALARMRAAAEKYIEANIEAEAREFLLDPVRLLKDKLEQDAMEHVLRQEIGDTAVIDELLRALRASTREHAESLPRKWIPTPPGHPRERGAADKAAERDRLRAEIKERKSDRKANGLRYSQAAVLEEMSQPGPKNTGKSYSALLHILYPPKTPKTSKGRKPTPRLA